MFRRRDRLVSRSPGRRKAPVDRARRLTVARIAVAVDNSGAHTMADLYYRFGDSVVDVMPTMSEPQINTALNTSNGSVLFHGGPTPGTICFPAARSRRSAKARKVARSRSRARSRWHAHRGRALDRWGKLRADVQHGRRRVSPRRRLGDPHRQRLCNGGQIDSGSNTLLENRGMPPSARPAVADRLGDHGLLRLENRKIPVVWPSEKWMPTP
jgi:hypothetical protein